ncbi:MAG: ABC transporter permease subunit [Pararhodobacter sp.]|nr:ABC transporter permease subunit [Pararhodobacter sp.]
MNGLRHWFSGVHAWAALIALTLALLIFRDALAWSVRYPNEWVVPLTPWLNSGMNWVIDHFGAYFRAFSDTLAVVMRLVRNLINALPWSVVLALVTVAAFALAGWRLALFSFAAVLYMVVIGFWTQAMNSLALVVLSVPIAVIIGFAIGTLGFASERADRAIRPTMDLLQTVPAFAYLLPILLLFGFGPVVGLIASLLYAVPPMVRNTTLGLRSVNAETVEAGRMSGATTAQLFWRVQVPCAKRQILLGINQTTMAAFSMVIIASIIGGTADIGWEVLTAIRRALFGESLLLGLVIALMAMVMDRLTARIAVREITDRQDQSFAQRYRYWIIALILALGLSLLAQVMPFLSDYPREWRYYPAAQLNAAVTYIVAEFSTSIDLIKRVAFFYVMLPVKMGLERTISPFSWGFTFTDTLKVAYAVAIVALTGVAWLRRGWRIATLSAFIGILLFVGITGMPWPTMAGMAVLLAYQVGGRRMALGMAAGMGFLLLTGIWQEAMLSVYLCGIAVLLSFVIGGTLGVLAAEFRPVSAVLRPINDTLQTMPLFVILIPFVMIFKIGEFTALLAIIAYAIVPSIRYTELGIRGVSPEAIEAGRICGCTPWQLLWRVKLPLASPVIMLGLNQTIMYAIVMLVIAALVGTSDLGQMVYIGLGDGDFGVGIIAGVGMAVIAMLADRMMQTISRKQARN